MRRFKFYIIVSHLLKDLATLQLGKDGLERTAETPDTDGIENAVHLAVAGYTPDAEHFMQTVRLFLSAFLKRKQRGVLEAEHGKTGHQRIVERNTAVVCPMIGDPAKILADGFVQGIGIEMAAHLYPAKGFTCVAVLPNKLLECLYGDSPCNILISHKNSVPFPWACQGKNQVSPTKLWR